jgi:YesN/AraC family two-component response regulator
MITDVRMPELSGIQLTEKVKEINPNIKVVLTTAYDMRENELSRLLSAARIDGFIQKPIGIEELNNKILSIMGSVE